MSIYRDHRGREISFRIDVAAAERMRDMAGVDVLDFDTGWLDALATDLETTVNVMHAVAKPQISETPRRFAKRLARRDNFAAACTALRDGLCEFFPEPKDAGDESHDAEASPKPNNVKPEPFGWAELYGLGGVAGVDPRTFTLRELLWLARGRTRQQSEAVYNPVATLTMIVFNALAKKRKGIEQFNPHYKRPPIDWSKPRTRPL